MKPDRWTQVVAEANLDGWLVADFRRSNPTLSRLLGLESGILTRRCFLWLPARGEPQVLASVVDGATFHGLEVPVTLYKGFADMHEGLERLLSDGGRVAMEYVEQGKLPTVSRVDAGLVEMIRSFGVTVESSGELLARLEVWDARQRELEQRAGLAVDAARREALRFCAEALGRGDTVTEDDLAQRILSVFEAEGMETAEGPDIAVGSHAADPHYSTAGGPGAPIPAEEVLLIDLWCKVAGIENAPYADSTWMAYTGPAPSDEFHRVFAAVRRARDEAIEAIDRAAGEGQTITGRAVDRVAKGVLVDAGLGQYLIGRTGHSLGTDHVHGVGTNLDDVEFPDDRPLFPWTGFTIEPGAYFPGRFGIRLEVSALLEPDSVRLTTERQEAPTLLD